ncbi:hypothetical protein [Microvirga guangxiensis]|uniref:hypothetical protein n=1 Tax=Microvirga guangxiensis TaxID=549386 RepID=UPI003138A9AA
MLSAFAVISSIKHAIYGAVAAFGSWICAFISIPWHMYIRRPKAKRNGRDASAALSKRKRSAEARH